MKSGSLLAIVFLFGLLIGQLIQGCSARAGGGQARVIPGGLPGYTCFGIEDGAGNIVGGNCIRD